MPTSVIVNGPNPDDWTETFASILTDVGTGAAIAILIAVGLICWVLGTIYLGSLVGLLKDVVDFVDPVKRVGAILR